MGAAAAAGGLDAINTRMLLTDTEFPTRKILIWDKLSVRLKEKSFSD